MRITKRALYLQSCKQSVIIGKWKCKHCFSRAHFRTAGRPSAHTDGKNNLKRNSFRQNDQRNSGREASEFSYHQQSPKNIFRKLGVNNVHEATKYAMRAGIVDLAEYYI